eukprot:3186779-Rhodomonas_salina.1
MAWQQPVECSVRHTACLSEIDDNSAMYVNASKTQGPHRPSSPLASPVSLSPHTTLSPARAHHPQSISLSPARASPPASWPASGSPRAGLGLAQSLPEWDEHVAVKER